MEQIIIYAIPAFVLLMAAEWVYGLAVRRNTYGFGDTLSSLGQGLLSQVSGVFTQIFQIGIYSALYPYLNRFPNTTLWQTVGGWVLAVVLYDFFDYWLHRVSHERAIFWAAHVVHHQSQHFNFSTALRQESAYPVLGWIFYIPMAVAGVPPEQYAAAGLIVLVYQFWIHTEHVGKLGWFDRVFSSPSNHRVHHATNPRFIDRNYGAILVVWDRIFGTFQEEDETCVYGTLEPLNSWSPLDSLLQVYRSMFAKLRQCKDWRQAARGLMRSPGWIPPEIGVGRNSSASLLQIASPYNPGVGVKQRCLALMLFLLLAVETIQILWLEDQLPVAQRAIAAVLVFAGLCCVGRLTSRRDIMLRSLILGLIAIAACQICLLPMP